MKWKFPWRRRRAAGAGAMSFEEFLELPPKFHLDEHGDAISWGLAPEVLRAIVRHVAPGEATLETGAGLSTVTFAFRGCRHTAVSPAAEEFEKIRGFCAEHQIGLDDVRFVAERSEFALPKLALRDLALVLVDGRHAFPSPYVDWFYGAEMLRLGGMMVIDDTQLETGRVLKAFMDEDPRWRRLEEIGKTVFFEKRVEDVHGGEWTGQPYMTSRT